MVNKLDNTTPALLRRAETARADSSARTASAPPASAAASAARTSQAGNSSLLARATMAAHNAPEVDQSRVDAIKTAIARGEFRVDAEATARAFIDMEAALNRGD